MTIIGNYYYIFGSGCQPNRHLEFVRDETTKKIVAITYEIIGRGPKNQRKRSQIEGENLIIEGWTNSEQKAYFQAKKRNERTDPLPEDCILDSYRNPEEILKQLEPKGPWRIRVENHFDENSLDRDVPFRLTFVNMS